MLDISLRSIREPTSAILIKAETCILNSAYPFENGALPLQIEGIYIPEKFYKSGGRSILKILDDGSYLKIKGVGHKKKDAFLPKIYYDGQYVHAYSPEGKGVDGFLKKEQAKNEIFWISELKKTDFQKTYFIPEVVGWGVIDAKLSSLHNESTSIEKLYPLFLREKSDIRADEVLESLKAYRFPDKADYLAWLGAEIGICLKALHDYEIIHCKHRPHIGNFLVSGENIGVCDFSSSHKAENKLEKRLELTEIMESGDPDFAKYIEQGYVGEDYAINNKIKRTALDILSS